MALATQGMRNNLNLSYFVASEHSCAIDAFCKNILHVIQLLALLTLDLWAIFRSIAVLLRIENSGRRTHMYSRLASDFCVPEDCFNLWSPWPCLPRAGFVEMHNHAWFMCAEDQSQGLALARQALYHWAKSPTPETDVLTKSSVRDQETYQWIIWKYCGQLAPCAETLNLIQHSSSPRAQLASQGLWLCLLPSCTMKTAQRWWSRVKSHEALKEATLAKS